MKGILVFIVLLVAVVHATKQHVHKDNAQGDKIDKLNAGLKEVENHLPPNSSVSFKMPEGAGADLYILWRYLLAPRYISIYDKEHFDTVFAICNMNAGDSLIHAVTDNRTVLCSSKDGQYKYYLTCNRK